MRTLVGTITSAVFCIATISVAPLVSDVSWQTSAVVYLVVWTILYDGRKLGGGE
jgi:hypothetical protein